MKRPKRLNKFHSSFSVRYSDFCFATRIKNKKNSESQMLKIKKDSYQKIIILVEEHHKRTQINPITQLELVPTHVRDHHSIGRFCGHRTET